MHLQANRLRLILTTDKAFMAERRANSDRPRRSFGLGAHFASHQLLHRVAHRLALVHHAMDFAAYRHVDGQLRGNGTDRTRREYAFDDLLDPALRLLQGLTTAEGQPQSTISRLIVGTGED